PDRLAPRRAGADAVGPLECPFRRRLVAPAPDANLRLGEDEAHRLLVGTPLDPRAEHRHDARLPTPPPPPAPPAPGPNPRLGEDEAHRLLVGPPLDARAEHRHDARLRPRQRPR